MSKMKFGFFFGAGAEQCYRLPTGADFTVDTMYRKREKMYNELVEFYKKRKDVEYAGGYEKHFHFYKNDTKFRGMVKLAIEKCCSDYGELWELVEASEKKINNDISEERKQEKERLKKQLNQEIEQIYQKVIIDVEQGKGLDEKYEKLIKKFSYCDAIEGKFSSIINPKEAKKDFWKLTNYFWSCYMAIMIPLLQNSLEGAELEKFKENNYKYVLRNLQSVLNHINPEKNKKIFEHYKECDEFEYYRAFKELKPECVLTTNYTPFIEQFETKNKSYLAGELRTFEVPSEFIIDQFDKIDDVDNKFIFPYMLTQAPVKPIINPKQIEDYSNALKYLKVIDILVVIGYGINGSDDHINAMLNEFLCKQKKKVIYWDYVPSEDKEKWDISKRKSEIMEKLRIKQLSDENLLEVVRVDKGDEQKKLEELKVKLNIV